MPKSTLSGSGSTFIKLPLTVACKTGSLKILEIQQEGKKPMLIEQFILGYNEFSVGTIIPNG